MVPDLQTRSFVNLPTGIGQNTGITLISGQRCQRREGCNYALMTHPPGIINVSGISRGRQWNWGLYQNKPNREETLLMFNLSHRNDKMRREILPLGGKWEDAQLSSSPLHFFSGAVSCCFPIIKTR